MRRALPALLVSLAILAPSGGTSHAAGEPFADVCARLEATATADPGVTLGLVVVDLASGARCAVHGDREFRSASLYKLFVMAEAFQQRADGSFSLEEPLLLEPRHAIDDPPALRPTANRRIDTGQAVERMIQFSDNSSAEALRERLGYAIVDARPAALGLEHTVLMPRFVTTPDDIADFFVMLYRGEIVDPGSSFEMTRILLGQEINDLIPRGIDDPAVPVAHKTGILETVLHDAGIVYAPAGDFVLVTMTEHTGNLAGAYAAIQAAASAAFAAYAGADRPSLPPEAGAVLAGELARGEVAALDAASDPSATFVAPPVIVVRPVPSPDTAPADAATPAPPAEEERADSAGAPGWLDDPRTGAGALAAIGVLLVLLWISRRPGRARGRTWVVAGAAHGALVPVAEGNVPMMRFGGRREQESGSAGDEAPPPPPPVQAPPPPPLAAAEGGDIPSERLRRVVELFRSHAELLEQMRLQFQDELQPLNELLARQGHTMDQLLVNLEARLRPLHEYAESEERNLEALEHQMRQGAGDFVARSFAEYMKQQRQRITETRQQIEEQRVPFRQYGEDQRDAVEIALARFDGDVDALEGMVTEQRKIMIRMLDSMRSDSFVAVKEFLEHREEALAELASGGITDPGEISEALARLRQAVEQVAGDSSHIKSVLDATDAADRRLQSAAPGPQALPKAPSSRRAAKRGPSAEPDDAEMDGPAASA